MGFRLRLGWDFCSGDWGLVIIVHKTIFWESVSQFFTTLIIFCAVIVISQLVRLSEVLLAFGLTLENIFLPFIYIIVPFLPIIIPISMIFSSMLTFSRLSQDGEYVALLAAGYPLKKLSASVLILSALVYGLATFCSLHLEAWGRREFVQFIYRKTQTELDNIIRNKIQPGVFLTDFLGYVLYTENISSDRKYYQNVMLAPGKHHSESDFVLFAPSATISGSVENGDLKMSFQNGMAYSSQDVSKTSVLNFEHGEIDLLRVFQSQILGADAAEDDYRSYTHSQLVSFIRQQRELDVGQRDPQYLRAWYLLLSRFLNPLIVFAFCLFGIVLGITEQRHGKNLGYIGAIATVIGSFVVIVGFRWLTERGRLPPVLGAMLPLGVLLSLAVFLFRQRNRLPPSESVWNLKYWPILRFVKKRE